MKTKIVYINVTSHIKNITRRSEIECDGENLVLEVSSKRHLFLVRETCTSSVTGETLRMSFGELTDFIALQTFKERTVFKLMNMGFTKKDTRKSKEKDLTTFTRTFTGAKRTC